MRLVTYGAIQQWRVGVLLHDRVVDAAYAAQYAKLPHNQAASTWTSMRQVLQAPPSQLHALAEAAQEMVQFPEDREGIFWLHDVYLGPPVPDPEKILCLALNYRDHAEEANFSPPPAPVFFGKFRNSLIGPTSPIMLPRVSQAVDYEAELAVVIGKRCKEVSASEALSYIAGVMAFNDVSARDLLAHPSQLTVSKALDTFGPCGPALVLMDEVPNVQNLRIFAKVNGQIVQQANTSAMIFSVADTVAYISGIMTLEPGDIIATGTPSGVGFKRTPPLFLHDGDVVEVEIDGIGVLRNPVVAL